MISLSRLAIAVSVSAIVFGTSCTGAEQALPEPNVESVWTHLQEAQYQSSWNLFPGTQVFQQGSAPHGALLTTYVNDVGYQALTDGASALPVGSIIVKENYMPDRNLAATTVMIKRPTGYNEAANDWYWLKRNADGSVDADGVADGCQSCHGQAESRDYVMTEVE